MCISHLLDDKRDKEEEEGWRRGFWLAWEFPAAVRTSCSQFSPLRRSEMSFAGLVSTPI